MRTTRRAVAILLVLILTVALASCGKDHESSQEKYDKAVRYVYNGEYDKAIKLFEELEGFSDSAQYILYAKCLKLGFSGEYDTAMSQLESLKSFQQAEQYITYFSALKQESQQNYEQAREIFHQIPVFRDVPDRLAAIPEKIRVRDYASAESYYNSKNYSRAQSMFVSLGSYRDSAARARQCEADSLYANRKYADAWLIYATLDAAYSTHAADYADTYKAAESAYDKGDYETALSDFTLLGTYSDSTQKVTQTITAINDRDYASALSLKEAAKYEEAISAFTDLNGGNGYKDSKDQIAQCQTVINDRDYAAALALKEAEKFEEAIAAFVALNDGKGYKDSDEQLLQCRMKAAAVSDIVTFGTYEQDNDTTNGKEPIEWIVLDKRYDGSLVLMSKYALDAKPYNKDRVDVTWETCTLRKWLNRDFYNAAFSAREQAKIVPVTLENEDNPYYNTTGGKATQDKVWLLSINEVTNRFNNEKVYSYFSDYASRMCAPTKYAVEQGAWQSSDYTVDGVGACWWWLRSPGNKSNRAAYVYCDGVVYYSGDFVRYSLIRYSVRPVVVVLP